MLFTRLISRCFSYKYKLYHSPTHLNFHLNFSCFHKTLSLFLCYFSSLSLSCRVSAMESFKVDIPAHSTPQDLSLGLLNSVMTVFVNFTKKDYVVLPCNSAPPTTTVEESCAICQEDTSELPTAWVCACVPWRLSRWLGRHDSCPLCRLSTTPLTNGSSRILEELTVGLN